MRGTINNNEIELDDDDDDDDDDAIHYERVIVMPQRLRTIRNNEAPMFAGDLVKWEFPTPVFNIVEWTLKNHHSFPIEVKRRVYTWMLIAYRLGYPRGFDLEVCKLISFKMITYY